MEQPEVSATVCHSLRKESLWSEVVQKYPPCSLLHEIKLPAFHGLGQFPWVLDHGLEVMVETLK